jgi:hypothetical protein
MSRMVTLALAVAVLGCGPAPPRDGAAGAIGTATVVAPGAVPEFAFAAFDGSRITSESLRGRMTVVGLGASSDDPSLAQARFLSLLLRRHVPRLNVLLLMLEPAANEPLARLFASTLDLRYPVAMADAATVAGTGVFPGLHHVPSVVLLDRAGREVWRHVGLIDAERLSREIAGRDEEGRRE